MSSRFSIQRWHIFKRANLGIVADYKTVLPALTAELGKALHQ